MTRALALLCALAAACGTGFNDAPPDGGYVAPECFPIQTEPCEVWVTLPQIGTAILWPCTTGIGHPEEGKPDHRPCLSCWPPQRMWCEAGNGSCVADCATCTPSIVETLSAQARCSPEANGYGTPPWLPRDMTYP